MTRDTCGRAQRQHGSVTVPMGQSQPCIPAPHHTKGSRIWARVPTLQWDLTLLGMQWDPSSHGSPLELTCVW